MANVATLCWYVDMGIYIYLCAMWYVHVSSKNVVVLGRSAGLAPCSAAQVHPWRRVSGAEPRHSSAGGEARGFTESRLWRPSQPLCRLLYLLSGHVDYHSADQYDVAGDDRNDVPCVSPLRRGM